MDLTHINNISRSSLDKHIHSKKFLLFQKIPVKEIIDYILKLVTQNDSYWVDFGYELNNIKYLWIEYYFNIILKNFGNSEQITTLFNKINSDYTNIKSALDSIVCDIYNNIEYLPEYPNIKITKIFYNLLDINKTYTSQIKGIYPKKLNHLEKKNLLFFSKLNTELINKCYKNHNFDNINLNYMNRLQKNINNFDNIINNI